MKASDLKPAGQLAMNYGVKALVYGGPGTGKTPALNTAPNCVLLACEPGLLSMRGSQLPTFEAYTYARIKEFFKWFFESAEARKFDTFALDSISQMAEIFLAHHLGQVKHGQKAYGSMASDVIEIVDTLYFMQQKHVVLLAKEHTFEEKTVTFSPVGLPIENSVKTRGPYFPGQELNIKIPHRYDEILQVTAIDVSGVSTPAFRTRRSDGIVARDRSGRLNEYEPTNYAQLFAKCLST